MWLISIYSDNVINNMITTNFEGSENEARRFAQLLIDCEFLSDKDYWYLYMTNTKKEILEQI